MITIKTVPGKTYAVTSAADCTVATSKGLLIAACTAGEQMIFVAPTEEVQISDDAALVTESFKGASLGSSAGGGLSATEIEDMLTDETETYLYEQSAQWMAPIHWAQIDGSRVTAGRVDYVEIPCQTNGGLKLETRPVYLTIWEADTTGAYSFVGISSNAVVQRAGSVSRWQFENVVLHGRSIRVCPTIARNNHWDDSLVLGACTAPRQTDGDASVLLADGARSAVRLTAIIATVERSEKYASVAALTAHASDAVSHVTAEERRRWDAGASADLQETVATLETHLADSSAHVPPAATRFISSISDTKRTGEDVRFLLGDKKIMMAAGDRDGNCDAGCELGQARLSANALSVAVMAGTEGVLLRANGPELLLDAEKLQALSDLLDTVRIDTDEAGHRRVTINELLTVTRGSGEDVGSGERGASVNVTSNEFHLKSSVVRWDSVADGIYDLELYDGNVMPMPRDYSR